MDMNLLTEEVIRLVEIMEKLRGPGGCPWDREQDYFSLKPYIIEEAYEVIEALDRADLAGLKEELGDLLLQVVFQAQIAREEGVFDLVGVVQTISDKLVRRHPHVFADQEINSTDELKTTWEEIKREERAEKGLKEETSLLSEAERSQPALMQAHDIQSLAARVGFDWDNVEDVFAKIEEELLEVRGAAGSRNQIEIEREMGDLLFAVVNLTRFYGVNPELALYQTITKFRDRFQYIEDRLLEKGSRPEEVGLEEMDYYWEESKTKLKGEEG